MRLLQRQRWFIAAAGIALAYASLCVTLRSGAFLVAVTDLLGLVLMTAAVAICLSRAVKCPRHERSFWALMALGFAMWASNQAAWSLREIILHQPIPDPFFFDIVLFFHAVPMFAAVAWRPDLTNKRGNVMISLVNFLMLLGWWVFLYAFIVFPHQYVVLDVAKYSLYYGRLYGLENSLMLGMLGFAALTSSGGWRRIYLQLLGSWALYGANAMLLDRAKADSSDYTGTLYDVPLIATSAWIVATFLSSRDWELSTDSFHLNPRWKKLVPQLAMLAILSLPILGLWTLLEDKSPASSRAFRIFAVLAAMLLLGTFVFLLQYVQDQTLMSLLRESRRSYQSQKQLQSQLVQKEKLASLGHLVAGAAHEINHPLNAIMNYSEMLWSKERLSDEQNSLLRKIVHQARRTSDLVGNLLSFAQQAPGDKNPVDVRVLLSRATQMLESRRVPGRIQVRLSISPELSRAVGNANQLFQSFVEIIENALDALDVSGGGRLEITAEMQGEEIVLQFSDTGPGLREPDRVFDPFYTTKPVGQGTGLGLSAVYGVIQDHGGQITCRNKAEGGALFVVRLPVITAAAQSAGAAG